MLRVVVCWRYEACREYGDEDARQPDGCDEDCTTGAGIVDEEAFWVCACFDMTILESAAKFCYSSYSWIEVFHLCLLQLSLVMVFLVSL